MNIILASDIQEDSIVDGEGIRTVIWTQGCSHNCLGCHNPETHDFNTGISVSVDELNKKLDKLEFQDGITFSGGDPMFQAKACAEVAKHAKKLNLNVWCYTGFTFEQLLELANKNKSILEFLENIDVLIDGKFDINLKSFDLKYRGSKNQRIIDVKLSLEKKKACVIDKYMQNRKKRQEKKEYLFV